MKNYWYISLLTILLLSACQEEEAIADGDEVMEQLVIDRDAYQDKLEGFWLGECIANWTGLNTEMDKIGDYQSGELHSGDFYTREDWGTVDRPNVWGDYHTVEDTPRIDFVLKPIDSIWGADDDTDIEYMYQFLLNEHQTTRLTPEQIRKGWLRHIRKEEENYLWVSNQKAYDLMGQGILPPETSDPSKNPFSDMIDAQLTTEVFGLYAPGSPVIANEMACLPIRTTARGNAELDSKFYVTMYALAAVMDSSSWTKKQQILWMADEARKTLLDTTYSALMYDFVKAKYESGIPWEAARDSIYQRYSIEGADGYYVTEEKWYCNGCFAAGINFSAGLVSLFYGEGDFKETVKIGSLCGWDSDNPTATWGGMLGFMMGRKELEKLFGPLSNRFNIHRTRQNFPNNGLDTFEEMAKDGIKIVDRVVLQELGGQIDSAEGFWIIPISDQQVSHVSTCLGNEGTEEITLEEVSSKTELFYDGRYMGFKDENEQVIVKAIYDAVGSFSEGLAPVTKDGKSWLIDMHGSKVIEMPYSFLQLSNELSGEFWLCEISDGLIPVVKDEKIGFVNTAGELVIAFQFDETEGFREGLAAVNLQSECDATGNPYDGCWGYINLNGEWVVQPKYTFASGFVNGRARVFRDEKAGYIDLSGEEVIPVIYEHLNGDFNRRLVFVSKPEEEWQVIDRNGTVVLPGPYGGAPSFVDGKADVIIEGKCSEIDTTGKVIQVRSMEFCESEGC